MIVDDWDSFVAERDRQEQKWARSEVQCRQLELQEESLGHPPLSKSSFSAISPYRGPYGVVGQDGSKFETGITASGSGNVYDHPMLLQNSRTAYFESVQARGLVSRFADTVVDTGLRLEPSPKSDLLGISPDQAERWSNDVAQKFDCWFGGRAVLRDNTQTGYQFQRFIEILSQRDGEYFVRFHYSTDKSLSSPLQLSVVDPTQIIGYGLTDTFGFNRSYYDGIERDLAGRETAYHVMVLGKNGYQTQRIPAVGPRSKRRFMLHGYRAEYPGQGRGIPPLAHAIQEFSNITDFSAAQIMKAIAQSQTSLYVKPSKDAPAGNPFETQAGFLHEDTYGRESTTADVEAPHVTYSKLAEVSARIPGAWGVFGLQGGEDLKSLENTAPVESFANFVDAFMTYLAASTSMPLEVLTMKFGRSYTASMGALILFWRVAEILRMEMAADLLNHIYEAWLSEEIAAGRIYAPGWNDPIIKSAWLNAKWGGAPMPIIDPSKQSRADKEFAELGAHHLDDIARKHNGSDGRLNRAKLQRQYGELPVAPWGKKSPGGFGGDL